MTNRLKGFVVTLEDNLREDDAKPIMEAIEQLRGVVSVTPSVDNFDDRMNREKIRAELTKKIWEALKP